MTGVVALEAGNRNGGRVGGDREGLGGVKGEGCGSKLKGGGWEVRKGRERCS